MGAITTNCGFLVKFQRELAAAVPNGFTAGGLSTSLQIMCAPGQEAMALRIAYAYEQATEWRQRRPPGAA